MKHLPFIGYFTGVLLLASGCLWGARIITTPIPMYIGVGFIAISVFVKGMCGVPTTKSKGREE